MSEIDRKLVEHCRSGDIAAVAETLAAGADAQTIDYALQLAASNGDLELVKLLLERGAYVHADNNLALRVAQEHGHFKVARALRKAMAKRTRN